MTTLITLESCLVILSPLYHVWGGKCLYRSRARCRHLKIDPFKNGLGGHLLGSTIVRMRVIQNGLKHVKYRSSPYKNEAEEYKKLAHYISLVFCCYIYFIILLNFNLVQKMKHKIFKFTHLSFPFSFFLLFC